MSLANSVQRRLAYKSYTSAAISSGSPRDVSSDPGSSGGQILRFLPGNGIGGLQKSNFRSQENRGDQQIYDFRHGSRTAPINIQGELSPKTYQDLMAGVLRSSWASATSKTESDFTSMTISSGVATVGASTWAAQGFRVGDVVRFSNMSVAANNSKNFQIIGLSGTAATLYPAPDDNTSDTAFTVATVGRKVIAPSSPTAALFLFEEYFADLDLAFLHKECRLGQMQISMPAEGIVTCGFTGLGRDTERLASGSSPFFASPTAATTTNLLTSQGGQILVAGTSYATITSMNLNINIGTNSRPAAFTEYHPEIFTGMLDVTGSLTTYFESTTLPGYFDSETECEIAMMLTDSTSDAAEFISIFLPRVKFGGAQFGDEAQNGIPVTMPFQALLKATATGYDATTIGIQDSKSA